MALDLVLSENRDPNEKSEPKVIGYEFLQSRIPLQMPPLERPARIKPVTRIKAFADILAVPKQVAPEGESILEHALFALKHESLQLAVLHEAMKQVPAEDLALAIADQPQGANLRRAAFVWEKANETELPLPWPTTGGNYVDMLDPKEHYTGQIWEKSARLRVNFNGLGPYAYCPMVLRDADLERQGMQVLEELKVWATNPEN
ncbi:MAG: cell filamentation protein Fic, partial [Variovorax sp.]